MSLCDDLLTILGSYSGGYRLIRRKIHGYEYHSLAENFKETSEQTLRVTLSRLKKKGFVKNDKGIWSVTVRGLNRLTDKLRIHKTYQKQNKEISKKIIIIFDVPEQFKRKRQWLRTELKNLEFKLLQKSVWIGPAPIPEEFIHTLSELKIIQFIKFFEVKEEDVI